MASKYYGDLVFSTGEYEKDGEKKKPWSKAGAVFKDSETGNISIKFEAMPVGEWSGWMKVFNNSSDGNIRDGKYDKDIETIKAIGDAKKEVVLEDIDDKPIDLSEIPF